MKSAPAEKAIPSGAPASSPSPDPKKPTIRKKADRLSADIFFAERFSSQVSSSFIETAKFYQFYLMNPATGLLRSRENSSIPYRTRHKEHLDHNSFRN
ncbi:hypothetical protein HZU73_07906 [Apis mellifera caucasica]|nr:hypothetical protein HZU73_07906 [Apis mellifera caucasica]KAG9436576.1 hypothetical protein HZU67_01533 [Apis mellifera carnica]